MSARLMMQKKVMDNQIQAQNQYLTQTTALFKKFQEMLQSFAQANLHKVQKDPQVREQFAVLCQELKIDPLSSASSVFSKLLGDYYYRLAIKIIDYCELQQQNSISISKYVEQFNAKLNQKNSITNADVKKAITIISNLSPEYTIVSKNGEDFIQFSNQKMDENEQKLIQQLQQLKKCFFKRSELQQIMKWNEQLCDQVIEKLVNEGKVAVDKQGEGGFQDVAYFVIVLCEQ